MKKMESDQRGNIPLVIALIMIQGIQNRKTITCIHAHSLIFGTQEEASDDKVEREKRVERDL